MKIYVAAPAYTATGGPELLHQLCYVLRQNGFDAMMYYYHEKKDLPAVNPAYIEYQNPYMLEHEEVNFSTEDIFVIPETNIQLLIKIEKARKIFWWLSVDNFYNTLRPWRLMHLKKILDIPGIRALLERAIEIRFNRRKDKANKYLLDPQMIHLVQSYYAFDHCLQLGINREKIMYLSDYINPLFMKEAIESENENKENIILYNPKKGAEFTRKLIKNSNFQYIPLKGLSRKQMIELLKKAKVYIDFGNHPGKDRIPREAAICGCCVITDKRGSAKFFQDVPIPDDYKFDDKLANIPNIVQKIQDIFDNYEQRSKDFSDYRKMILGEEEKFKKDTVEVFRNIVHNGR